MLLLTLGLILFLGTHSVRIVADDWRATQIRRFGEGTWKGIYSLVSAAGLALVGAGYGIARSQPALLWSPPAALRHVSAVLVLIAFVLTAAAYVPGNRIRGRIGHPMVAGVTAWAAAHLMANGALHATLLFGAFLGWAALAYLSARRRDDRAGLIPAAGSLAGDAATLAGGVFGYAIFAFWLHARLIGVAPFG
ncbi:MAG: NnrU family protein [Chromatiales bacterium]|nr:NnrU family protein [Chromatiales bacterium]